MEFLDRIIKESLRLYPPVPFISRKFSEDFVHDGIVHRKDSVCNIFIYNLHRDPTVFPDPEKFDPDRFLPENSGGRNNFAFVAFSAGARNCIGQKFALLELKVVLTKVVSKFKILPVTSREEIVLIADLILRSKNPIKVKFLLRN
jgi:cytochrome P450 family 4